MMAEGGEIERDTEGRAAASVPPATAQRRHDRGQQVEAQDVEREDVQRMLAEDHQERPGEEPLRAGGGAAHPRQPVVGPGPQQPDDGEEVDRRRRMG